MPFVSQAQRRACYAKQRAAEKAGKTSRWNCAEWERETKGKKLPERVSKSKKHLISYSLFTKQEHDSLPKKHQNILDEFINTRKTYLTTFYVIAFVVAICVAATQANDDHNESLNFRYGRFFEWFAILFIPAVTLINLIVQLPLSINLNEEQLITMIFVFVYYFRQKHDDTQENYVNFYITALVWCIVSIYGLKTSFSIFENPNTIFTELGVMAIVISGGVGLKFVRTT